MKKRIGSGFFVALMLFCLSAVAQIVPAVDSTASATFIRDPNTYGTQAETAHTIFNQDFNVDLPTTTWGSQPGSWLRYTGGSGFLEAPLLLPEGAAITAIEVEGCDNSATGALEADLLVCSVPAGACNQTGPIVNTGAGAFPGCALFRANFSSPLVVNNVANSYLVQEFNPGDSTGAVSFRAVRMYYKLQVSPAPSTARFTDVPTTHVFFQYIEALAASGITSGCTASTFCPDAPLTRGQMAVFLARALGLHWAP